MKTRWVDSIQRFLVLVNYGSLPPSLLLIGVGRKLGWNAAVIAVLALAAAAFVASFIRVHVTTGFWKLTHTFGAKLDEAEIRLTRSAAALGFIWFVVICLSTLYFKVNITFNRLNVLDMLAYIYLADTLPSSVLAWRGASPMGFRDTLVMWGKRVLIVIAILLALFLLNLYLIRPWQHHWGARPEEISRTMPGDELVGRADMNATRAVTVAAPPEDVWPWLVQLGYRRAGFYSLDYLDNDGITSARRILPEYQDLAVGDQVPLGPGCFMRVVSMEPQSSLVLQFEEGPWEGNSWVFGLYPDGPDETRLISRLRASYQWEFPHILPWLFIDTFEIIMMSNCLLGIKERVEAVSCSEAAGAS